MGRAKQRQQRIQHLEEQAARIQAETRRLKALVSQEERERETRRKILVGSMVLALVERGEWPEQRFKTTRARALFEPPPQTAPPVTAPERTIDD